jgi:hypothetical protein
MPAYRAKCPADACGRGSSRTPLLVGPRPQTAGFPNVDSTSSRWGRTGGLAEQRGDDVAWLERCDQRALGPAAQRARLVLRTLSGSWCKSSWPSAKALRLELHLVVKLARVQRVQVGGAVEDQVSVTICKY